MNALTAISVVVARMIPTNVRTVRSLFFRRESSAMRLASQKDAVGRNFGAVATLDLYKHDVAQGHFVPLEGVAPDINFARHLCRSPLTGEWVFYHKSVAWRVCDPNKPFIERELELALYVPQAAGL